MNLSCSSLVVFFFQAADGIRDATVTGVQTCALPISASARLRDRIVDGAAGRPTDRAAVRGALPSCARLAPAGTVGLELPAPGRSRAGARRTSHPALEAVPLAPA